MTMVSNNMVALGVFMVLAEVFGFLGFKFLFFEDWALSAWIGFLAGVFVFFVVEHGVKKLSQKISEVVSTEIQFIAILAMVVGFPLGAVFATVFSSVLLGGALGVVGGIVAAVLLWCAVDFGWLEHRFLS